jgi:hypothetical protein
MKLEIQQKIKFLSMLLSIMLGFFLMIVQIAEYSLMEVILTKLAGIGLIYFGFRKAKSIFKFKI